MIPSYLLILLSLLFIIPLHHINAARQSDNDEQQQQLLLSSLSPEALYRQTFSKWQMSNRVNWNVWSTFSNEIQSRFVSTTTTTSSSSSRQRLELVGAIEESIVQIEKLTVGRGEGTNVPRDVSLSNLYLLYANVLSQLSPAECKAMALDPYTLLIGADTVSNDDEPRTFLCVENAENSLRNAITLDATNEEAERLLQVVTSGRAGNTHERKPKEFVAELFDSFAESFDRKLGDLGYKVPRLVGDAARRLLRESGKGFYRSVLDAGCGTGLSGRFVRPLLEMGDDAGDVGIMIGVDASQKMLDVASRCTITSGCGMTEDESKVVATDTTAAAVDSDRSLYDGLLQMDLEDVTVENTIGRLTNDDVVLIERRPNRFDLIVAADVFVYFGSLEKIISVFSNISQSDDDGDSSSAALVFSCERATDDEAPLGWRLLPTGRFAHTKRHVVEVATKVGYELISYEEIVPRMERGEEVKGHLFGFVLKESEKKAASSSSSVPSGDEL